MAEVKHLVRIGNTDLDGNKGIVQAIRKIKGVGFSLAKAICYSANIDPTQKAGLLTDIEVQKIEDVVKNPSKHGIPVWMHNRRKDPETGSDMHLVTSELDFAKSNDIRLLKKIKAYRGVRHMYGLPTRGQRTRSNFRRNKGKPMGVIRSKAAKAAQTEKK